MNTMTPTATLYVVTIGEDVVGVYQSEQDAQAEVDATRRTSHLRPVVVPAPYYPTQAR